MFAEAWKKEKGTSPTVLDLMTYDEDDDVQAQHDAPRRRRRRRARRKAAANA